MVDKEYLLQDQLGDPILVYYITVSLINSSLLSLQHKTVNTVH